MTTSSPENGPGGPQEHPEGGSAVLESPEGQNGPQTGAQGFGAIQGYCPACGRGDCAPTAEEYEQQRQRAEYLTTEVTALRDDLRGITGARYIADSLDSILNGAAHNAGPSVRECAEDDRAYWERKDAGDRP